MLDNGSEVTCISQEFYKRNQETKKPILPINEKVINGAIGQKSTKLKLKLLLDVEISRIIIKVSFIVMLKLIKEFIFGYDSLTSIGMLLDTINQIIYYSMTNIRNTIRRCIRKTYRVFNITC